MHTMTLKEWEAKLASGKAALGGDFWNEDQIWLKAFNLGAVVEVSYKSLLSGLYCDVTLRMATDRPSQGEYNLCTIHFGC